MHDKARCPLARQRHHLACDGGMQEEVAHDAVQLLDRAMMAPEAPARDCMSAAAPAALHLALCQDGQHSRDALSLQTGISSLNRCSCPSSGVMALPVTQMCA